ncbi:unnamed protein product [Porites lobata]|uniref:Uncharacterized protein n=1 Tax=Porites lobata TaxID=104759 RepID=A0ABN8P548_9CNID|nr:unnamed protein product [Porites lobata]
MIESDHEPDKSNFQRNTGFGQTQRVAIEAIVTDSVRSTITTLQTSPAAHLPSPAAQLPSASPQSLFTPAMASPLGLSRPVDKRYFCPIHYTKNLAAPSLCASTSTSPLAAGAEIAASPTCAAAAIPAPTPPRNAPSHSPAAPTRPQDLATAARSKVEQQQLNHKPLVSSPIDIYRLELELATHPNRNFVYNLLSTLKEGARIGYTGPRSDWVSPNLISAAQHP